MSIVPVEMCETQQFFGHFHQAGHFFLFWSFFLFCVTCRPEGFRSRIVYRRRSQSRGTGSLARFQVRHRQELALTVIVAKPMGSVMETYRAVQMLADQNVASRHAEAEGLLRDL